MFRIEYFAAHHVESNRRLATPMRTGSLAIVLACTVLVTVGLLWGAAVPLGVPGEWVWARFALTADTLFGAILAVLAGGLYVSFVVWGLQRIAAARPTSRTGLLIALCAASFVWLWTVQQSAPPPADLSKVPFVLYYPNRSSGYFWQARYDVDSTAQFLAHYEELMAERDFLHIGTHPPGLTSVFRGLLALCESSPAVTEAILLTCPKSVSEAFQTLASFNIQGTNGVTPADRAAMWLGALLVLACAAATAGGIYLVVRRFEEPTVAWAVAALWPLVPAIAVFHPKSDALFPFIAVMAAALWLRANDRASYGRALLAGLVLWIGMMLSLAFLTIGLLLTVMTIWEWTAASRQNRSSSDFEAGGTWKSRSILLAAGAAGFIVPTILLWAFYHVNLLSVWSWNFANHALFYEHNSRTWWKWLLVNPLELAFAVGLPIFFVAACSGWQLVRRREFLTRPAALVGGFLLVWGALWLSGKNMGEAARLWVLLTPWVVMSTAPALAILTGLREPGDQPDEKLSTMSVAMVVSAQMLVCVATVLTIDGFHFTELVP